MNVLFSNKNGLSMGLLSWVVIGAIAGLVVAWRMPYRIRRSFAARTVLGLCGGVAGGFLSTFAGMGGLRVLDVGNSMAALAGALVVLFGFPDIENGITSRFVPNQAQGKVDEVTKEPSPTPAPEKQLKS